MLPFETWEAQREVDTRGHSIRNLVTKENPHTWLACFQDACQAM